MPVSLDLRAPPQRTFWCDTLCFEAFDDIVGACLDEPTARAELACRATSPAAARVARDLAERAGGSANAFANVALAVAFLDGRRTAAIVDAAASFMPGDEIDAFRGRNGAVRRFPLALHLFEVAPEALLAIELWDQWHARGGAWYRIPAELPAEIDVSGTPWADLAASVIAEMPAGPGARWSAFEPPVVFGGGDEDVILGLREWPRRQAVRLDDGVVTGDRPSWTLLRVYDGGRRIDVTDRLADRCADLATAMIRRLRPGAGEFEQVMNELTDDVLDAFLRRITGDDPDLPLIEITAVVPWDARHREVVQRGRPNATASWLVADQRRRGPFAEAWRTVKSVKLLFEGAHKIEVHFPVPGRHRALSFSDIDRDKRVTRRFSALLNRVLKCEVAPKARAGSRVPRAKAEKAPRPRSGAWWTRLLVAKHDRPPPWIEDGLRELASDGLVRCSEVGVIRCGDPHLHYGERGDRWAECNGEIELSLKQHDDDDPSQAEDDGLHECSVCGFRWRPRARAVPVDLRVKVELVHERAWGFVMEEAAHYGPVEEEPGRVGVASVRLSDARAFVAYEPMLAPADDAAWGASPVARIAAPFGHGIAGERVQLARVLASDDVLAPAWGKAAPRHREKATQTSVVPPAMPGNVIELAGPRSVRVAGRAVPKHGPSVHRLARLLALADFRAGERGGHDARALLTLAKDAGICAGTDTEHHLHVLVQRGREGVDHATGVAGRGAEAFVSERGYRLGDGWEVRQTGERPAAQV